mmetsp:Transcript_63848/g.195249  ORF Transcript_63848/g.195249 Transcript_63848/m.195249 type:complete len:209 (+) Transcript_63848:563-1189(+)
MPSAASAISSPPSPRWGRSPRWTTPCGTRRSTATPRRTTSRRPTLRGGCTVSTPRIPRPTCSTSSWTTTSRRFPACLCTLASTTACPRTKPATWQSSWTWRSATRSFWASPSSSTRLHIGKRAPRWISACSDWATNSRRCPTSPRSTACIAWSRWITPPLACPCLTLSPRRLAAPPSTRRSFALRTLWAYLCQVRASPKSQRSTAPRR